MSVLAILLLLQSAAPPPVAQGAQDDASGTAPLAVEHTQEFEASSGGPWAPNGKRDGRRGNDLYGQEAYADAAAAYAGGLAILSDDVEPRLRYGLRNNLGAALLKSGNAESARQTFEQAIAEAGETGEPIDLSRSAYNAGNAAFAAQDLDGALAYYRHSLLRNPDNADARFNYEFVKRRIEEQQNRQQQDRNQEQDQQESGNENSDDGQNEQQQDESEPQQQQNGQNEQQGENEQQQNESPQEQEQEQQNGQAGEQQLSQAQAERILQALEQEEGNLLREIQRTESRPHRVEKDW